MSRRMLVCGFLGVLLLGAGYWHLAREKTAVNESREQALQTVRDIAGGQVKPEDVAALVLKDFEMKQGEGGIQLWRLHAEWGGAQKDGNFFQVQQPRFTYFLPPDNEPLQVVSQQGDVNQATKIIRFFRGVEARLGPDSMKTEILVYNGTSKTMHFPDGLTFAKQGMNAKAAYAEWLLNDKIFNASGGVDVTWAIGQPDGKDAGYAPERNTP